MASDKWLRTIQIVRKETHCHHIGYSFRLTARVLLYALSHRQDSTYHSLCYTSRGALAGTRKSSMGPLWRIDPTTHWTMSSYHGATSHSLGDGFLMSYFLFQPVLHDWYNKGRVSGMVCKRSLAANWRAPHEEACCHQFIGYSFQLAARDLLYAPSSKTGLYLP